MNKCINLCQSLFSFEFFNGCVILEPLLPTLKFKRRYIAVEVLSNINVSRETFIRSVFSNSCSFLGDAGVAKSGLSVLGFENNKGIIRCNHKFVQKVICALSLITNIDGSDAIVKIAGVGGTIKSTNKKLVR